MRLLHFSDLHLDASGTDGSTADSRSAFRRICDLARDLRVDAVTCAGNLYDQGSTRSDTASVLRDGFRDIGSIPVYLAPGRTDWITPSSLYRQTWTDNVHVFSVPHLTAVPLGSGHTLWGAAHVAPVHQLGFLGVGAVFRKDADPRHASSIHIGLFHGCERAEYADQQAGTPLTAPFQAAQVRDAGLNHVLVGGLPLAKATTDFTYGGRPLPQADAEHDGGVVLITVHSDGSVEQEWHDVTGARNNVVQLRPPAETAPTAIAPVGPVAPVAFVQPPPAGGGNGNVFEKPGAVEPVRDKVVAEAWVDESPASEPDDPEHPENTVLGQFVRGVRRSELSPTDKERVLRIGLAAVSGHTDLGEL